MRNGRTEQVQINSGGRTLGRLSPDEFCALLGQPPAGASLLDLVELYNETKRAAGEADRAAVEFTRTNR